MFRQFLTATSLVCATSLLLQADDLADWTWVEEPGPRVGSLAGSSGDGAAPDESVPAAAAPAVVVEVPPAQGAAVDDSPLNASSMEEDPRCRPRGPRPFHGCNW